MNTKTMNQKQINIAPSSDNGHFVHEAEKVVNLDQVNETFLVEGKSKLVTKNHTTLNMDQDCIITCQVVYDPFKESFNKSKD